MNSNPYRIGEEYELVLTEQAAKARREEKKKSIAADLDFEKAHEDEQK